MVLNLLNPLISMSPIPKRISYRTSSFSSILVTSINPQEISLMNMATGVMTTDTMI